MRLSAIFFAFLVIFCFLVLCFISKEIYLFHTNTYQEIANYYTQKYAQIYQNQLFTKKLFTQKTHQQAFYFLYLGASISLSLFLILIFQKNTVLRYIEVVLAEISYLKKVILQSFSQKITITVCKRFFLVFFAVICFVWHQIYSYQNCFLSMDESFSWLYFGSQPFFVVLSHYPIPNNHIFYNLCVGISKIFISDAVLALRIPSIISFWALLVLVFGYLSKRANFEIAFLSVIMIGLGFSQSIFSVQGRGYMICTFLIVLALFSLLEYLRNHKKIYLVSFILACILGFLTVPVFLFPMIGFYAYLLVFQVNRHTFKRYFRVFFVVGLLVSAGVLLAYLPLFVYSGVHSLAGNDYVTAVKDNAVFFGHILPISIKETIIYLFSLPKYISFLICLMAFLGGFCILFSIKKRQKSAANLVDNQTLFYQALSNENIPNENIVYQKTFQPFFLFLLVSLVVAFWVVCLMRVFPIYRIWTYYGVFFSILLSFTIDFFFKKQLKNIVVLMIILAGLFYGSFMQFDKEIESFYHADSKKLHKAIQKEAQNIVKQKKSVYFDEDGFYIAFWLKNAHSDSYDSKKYLLQDECKADIAVISTEYVPACKKLEKEIWFLHFFVRK